MKSFYHQIIIIWHIYGEWHLNLVNRLKRNCQTWTGRKRFLPSQSITNEVKNNSTVIWSRFGNKFKFGAPNGTAELIGSLFWITMICSCLSVSCLYGACVCFFFGLFYWSYQRKWNWPLPAFQWKWRWVNEQDEDLLIDPSQWYLRIWFNHFHGRLLHGSDEVLLRSLNDSIWNFWNFLDD